MPMPMNCVIKKGVCGNPTDCRKCRHMPDDVEWVCPSCLEQEDRTSTYYNNGYCDRCGTRSAVTVALDLSTAWTGTGR